MVTLKDVAQKAGVSIATVSSVVNNSRPVAEETRKIVLKTIDDLGYRPNRSAQALKKGQTKKIVYIVPSITNLVFAQFVQEVQSILNQNGYNLLLYNNEAREDLTKSYVDMFVDSNIDGVIMTQTGTCGKIVADVCKERKIPLTVLFAPDILEEISTVLSDNRQGSREAVNHLLSYGHKKIGFVMVNSSTTHNERLIGYKEALAVSGLECKQERIIECTNHDELDSYVHLKEHLDSVGRNFSALICCNDYLAYGAIRLLRERGFKIPEDVSVIGYDDSIAQYMYPKLTSVTIPKEKLANTAVNILLEEIKARSVKPRRIIFPQHLVIRNTVQNVY